MNSLTYLTGYPAETIAPVKKAIAEGNLGKILLKKYPKPHSIRTDAGLYQYTIKLKPCRMVPPVNTLLTG